jgi:PAS domain S-box-containing protein
VSCKEKKEMYNSQIIDSINDVILIIDPANYQILDANKAALKLLKLDKENIVNKTCYEATHHRSKPCTPPNDTCPMLEMLKTQNSVLVEHQHYDFENRRIDVEVSVHPIKDKDEKIIQVLHIGREITERKEQERAEKARSEEILEIMDGIGDLLFVMDKNRVIIKVNKAMCEAFKKKPEELIGKHCFEIIHGTKQAWSNCPAAKTFSTKQTITEEVDDPNLGIPLLVTTSPILDEHGEVSQIIHIAKDISERKKIELKLKESEEKYLTAFEGSMDALMLLDEKGFFDCNTAALSLFGCKSVEEFTKNHPADLSPITQPDGTSSIESAIYHINKAFKTGMDSFFWIHKRKDESTFSADVLLTGMHLKNRDVLQATVRDITKSKKAEEELKNSQEEYSSLFINMVDGFAYCKMIFDESEKPIDFVYLQINDAFEKITGLKRELIVGKKVTQAIPGIREANSELFEIYRRVALTGQTERFEVFFKPLNMWLHISVYCPKKGYFAAIFEDTTLRKQAEQQLKEAEEKHRTLLNVANVLVQSVDAKGKYIFVNEEWKKVLGYSDVDIEKITMMDVVRKDHLQYCMSVFKDVMNGLSIHDVETIFVTKDGREITVSGNACPVFKDDLFVSTVAFFVDITERKKNEEKLKENSQRIELMNEKLRVVGGLSRHDVRNKLSTVTGYAYLLKKKHADQRDIVEGLSKMEQAVKESMKIFEFAKMYEQIGVEKLIFIDVEAKINEAANLFSGSLPTIINGCNGLSVFADSFLRQLFYNFIDNTRKYGQKTTIIKVHYRKTDKDDVSLVYEDNGVGISAENKLKLFSEGFSTGGSTGFGLFLTKKMIDVYGWSITEEGEPGVGARFVLTIPMLNNNGKANFQITSNKESAF